MKYRNWPGDAFAPAEICRPASVAEVSDIVARAHSRGRTVRAVGSGHSFGDQLATDGVLVDLGLLNGLTSVDPDEGTVTVAGGTKLWQLNQMLDRAGLALPNLGDIDRQSIAGATATATHGTGSRLGNLATGIVAMELVTADGSVRQIGEGDVELLRAARVAVGALGVVTSLTLRVVPTYSLRYDHGMAPFAQTCADIDELVDANDRFEFFVFPYTDKAWTKTINATDDVEAPQGRVSQLLNEFVVENGVLELVCRAGNRFNSAVPSLNRLLTRFGANEATRADRSHRILPSRRLVRFNETEWALPREHGVAAIEAMHAMVERRKFPVNFPLELRFVAADEAAFLSPSWGRDTAYVAAHLHTGADCTAFFRAVQEIAVSFGGRPHWGKRHELEAAALRDLYPAWDRFQAVRAALDPDAVFTNEHIRRVLGPVHQPGPSDPAITDTSQEHHD